MGDMACEREALGLNRSFIPGMVQPGCSAARCAFDGFGAWGGEAIAAVACLGQRVGREAQCDTEVDELVERRIVVLALQVVDQLRALVAEESAVLELRVILHQERIYRTRAQPPRPHRPAPKRVDAPARRGDEVPALAWLVASAMLAVVLHAAWISLSHFLLLNGERSAQGRRRSNRSILSGASTRFGAAFARQWIYLRRSPNNRVGFVYGTVFGIAFAMVQIVQQGEGNGAAAAFGILLAMMANLGAATNVLGFDAGSLWIEVLTGGPGRPHMMARQLIALPNLLLPTCLSGIVVGIWTGEWTLVLLVSMLAISIALNVLTFGMVASALAPAPLPDWDNPFGNRQSNEGRGLRLVIIALVGMISVTVLSAPILILIFRSFGNWWLWLLPFAALVYASVPFGLASMWVGRYLRGKEPDLIEILAPRAMN